MNRQTATTATLLFLLSIPLSAHGQITAVPTAADVIVYGSTPGGFCAAIAAAREGASVILLEPTDHVGAMSTGGLSHCDSNQMVRSTVMGLFDEWHTRVVQDYTDRSLAAPYDPSKKDQARWVFEPHVAMRVTLQMLAQKQVLDLPEVPKRPKVAKVESSSHSIDTKTPPGIVLDDAEAKLTGDWSHSTTFRPHIGNGYVFSGQKDSAAQKPATKSDGSVTATFRFTVPVSGSYELRIAYSAHESRATNVPVTVSSGRQKTTFVADQTGTLPSGQSFRTLKTFDLRAGQQTTITVGNANAECFVIVDALQLLLVK